MNDGERKVVVPPASGKSLSARMLPFKLASVDACVAAIISYAVSKSLKTVTPRTVDRNTVARVVMNSGLPSSTTQSLLDYLNKPESEGVIADAGCIAKQVFYVTELSQGRTPGTRPLASLSASVSADQILAAGRAAYRALGMAGAVPHGLWRELKTLNVG